MANNLGNFGLSLYGIDPYGSESALFGVAAATSLSPHFVRVYFTDIIDLTDAAYTDPTNYTITPTLAVHAAIIESADTVILETDAQSFQIYTVTVTTARSFFGIPMVPPNNTATFTGFPTVPGYFSVGTSPTRIRCIFSDDMLVNSALTDPTEYTVTDLNFNVLPVLNVKIEQTIGMDIPILSVVLTLGVSMQTTMWYQTILGPNIKTAGGQSPAPSDYDFQWVLPVQNVTVPISEFTGEVSGPEFGDPDGLVFFSPSLNVAAPNSVIQVEEVSVCTYAYDQYTFPPQHPDPNPFYVWSTQGPQTYLQEPGIVLFGGFPSMGEATFEFGMAPPVTFEPMPPTYDDSCSIVMAAGFAPGFVALLNNPAWHLYDEITSAVPPTFICANNGAPIPPGSEQITVIHQVMRGNSTMTVAEPFVVHWCEVQIVGNSSLATGPLINPLSINANSWMRVARPHVVLGASVHMVGGSSLDVHQQQDFNDATASIQGYAVVDAHVKQKWQVTAEAEGNSSIFTRANRHQLISAAPSGSSSLSALAGEGPAASAAIVGNSFLLPPGQNAGVIQAKATVAANALVQHHAVASIQGLASVVAAPTAPNRAASASIIGGSTMTAHTTPLATAVLKGESVAWGIAKVHHSASASLTGNSTLAATAT